MAINVGITSNQIRELEERHRRQEWKKPLPPKKNATAKKTGKGKGKK